MSAPAAGGVQQCAPGNVAAATWVGAVKTTQLLRRIRTLAVDDDTFGIRCALRLALESTDQSEQRSLLVVLADLLAVAAPLVDVDEICQFHERAAVNQAEFILGWERKQRLDRSARSKQAYAAKKAAKARHA